MQGGLTIRASCLLLYIVKRVKLILFNKIKQSSTTLNTMSQHIGFRCPDELVEAIHKRKKETGKEVSTLMIEALNFWLQNKPVEQSETSVLQSDEHIQQLIDNKTRYLADAMNEVKHSLESEIEALKTRLAQQEVKLGEY